MNDDIPLSTVRSHASTGARKANATTAFGNSTSFESSTGEKETEKQSFFHRHHGRRKKVGDKTLGRQGTGDSDDDSARLNSMGRIYAKIIGYSTVTRYLVYVAPVAILLAVPLIVLPLTGHRHDIPVGSTTKDGKKALGPPLFKLFLWIEITWLTLWAGKIVAWFLPKVFMFFCGIVSKGTRKYAKVLENMVIPISLFVWLLATWLTFQNLFGKSRHNEIEWAQVLETVLGALFACSAVLLGEKAIVQLIGISYHQRSFANRIKTSKRDIHLLGLLYDASRTLFPMFCPEFAEEDYVINDSIELMLRGKAGRPKSGAVTPMKLIGDVGRVGNKVTSVFGNLASEITGKKVFNPNSAHSIVLEALEKLGPSEALGRRIWMSFVVEGRESLFMEDFEEVLGPAYRSEAEEAFQSIDTDMNGDVSLDEMVRKTVEVGKERKAIAEGMKDIGQALEAFDKVLLFVWLLICVFIFCKDCSAHWLRMDDQTNHDFQWHSSAAVSSRSWPQPVQPCCLCRSYSPRQHRSFSAHAFSSSSSTLTTSVTVSTLTTSSSLWTAFPYCTPCSTELTRCRSLRCVRRLLTYAFWSNTSQIPNIVLNNLWIDNVSRSKAMLECISVDISYDTSFEDVELLRLEMEKFVRHPDNARDFQSDFSIGVTGVGNLDKLSLSIAIKHKSNWHNDSVRATRRSKFMCALALALKRVPIHGPGGGGEALGGPTNPSYSVAVTDNWASASRDSAAKNKDAARMVPAERPEDEQEALEQEGKAAAAFNSRPAVPETVTQWEMMREERLSAQQPLSPQVSEAATERRRSRDIEIMKTDLLKRASTRGRRRAGESLPSLADQESGAQLGPSASVRSPRLDTFDEEAATGMPSSYYELNRARSTGGASTTGLQPQQSRVHPLQSSPSQRRQQPGPDGAQGPQDQSAPR